MIKLMIFAMQLSGVPSLAEEQARMPEPPPIPAYLAPAPRLDPRVLARAEAGLARFRRQATPEPASIMPAMPSIPERMAEAPGLSASVREKVDAAFAPLAMTGKTLASVPPPSMIDVMASQPPESLLPPEPAQQVKQVSGPTATPISFEKAMVGLELDPLPENSLLASALKAQSTEPSLFERVKRKYQARQP